MHSHDMHERALHSGEDSEQVFENRSAVWMIQCVHLRCLTTEIGNFQDSQDSEFSRMR
jgi:hypothetical protein